MPQRVPRWLAIRESIQREIDVGRLPAGATIPSERELAARYHVSRMTIRQALSSFAANGTLLPQQGRGTVVAAPLITKNALGLASFSQEMRRRGLTPSSRVLSCSLAIASPAQISALQLTTPETVLVLRRVRLADDEPLALEQCVLPIRLVPKLDQHDFSSESLYEVLRQEYGVQPSHALETVTSRPATEEECRLLAITAPAALLCVRRQTFITAHQPFEYAESLYRGDAYSIAIHLQRVPEVPVTEKEAE